MLEVNGGFKKPKTKIMIIAASAAFVVMAGVAGFFAWQYFSFKGNPNKENEETIARLTGAVGNIYMLPDEKPTVAQVQDKEKLKDQTFFSKAENGDYILIYSENKLALLYREKDRKLVNVGPITISDSQNQQPNAQVQGATTPPTGTKKP
jgi:hypothetical protein